MPKIDGHPEYETSKDGELNDEHCFVYIFKAPKRHVNNTADKEENFSKREETLIFYQHQMPCLCIATIFYNDFFENE